MSDKVVIIGAGGHGKVIADIVLLSGDEVLGFLDDQEDASVDGFPWLGRIVDFDRFPAAKFFIAIGDSYIRERIAAQLAAIRWYTAIHPRAVVSPMSTEIKAGTAVMAGAVVNPGSRIGGHCIINTGAVVEHDNWIGDFTHVSVGAKLAGTVHVGSHTMIGAGAVIRNNLSICGDCIIGIGAAVTNDIQEPGIYIGVPAKRLHRRAPS